MGRDDTLSADLQINKDIGRKYWEDAAASDDGMLGGILSMNGFSSVARVDIQGSRTFLARLGVGTKNGRHSVAVALEGGAGIGRVTNGLLLPIAEQVDVIEPVAKFTDALQGTKGVRNVYNVGLEEWQPAEDTQYDLIWVQWCVGYITDQELVQFLERCKGVLTPETGFIVVKDNLSFSGDDDYDSTDSSVIRGDTKFLSLFKQAGLKVIKTELQRGFPEGSTKRLLPVRMYALMP